MECRSDQDSEACFVEDFEVNLFRTGMILFPILADAIFYFITQNTQVNTFCSYNMGMVLCV